MTYPELSLDEIRGDLCVQVHRHKSRVEEWQKQLESREKMSRETIRAMQALVHIASHDGGLAHTRLFNIEDIGDSPATETGIKYLHEEGYITAEVKPFTSGSTWVAITDKGREQLADCFDLVRQT